MTALTSDRRRASETNYACDSLLSSFSDAPDKDFLISDEVESTFFHQLQRCVCIRSTEAVSWSLSRSAPSYPLSWRARGVTNGGPEICIWIEGHWLKVFRGAFYEISPCNKHWGWLECNKSFWDYSNCPHRCDISMVVIGNDLEESNQNIVVFASHFCGF